MRKYSKINEPHSPNPEATTDTVSLGTDYECGEAVKRFSEPFWAI